MDSINYAPSLNIKGWHHKACEVLLPTGCCTCVHCQSNNLLQKVLVINSTDNDMEMTTFEVVDKATGKKKKCVALIRKLTERECGRLMGVDDKDITTIQQSGVCRSEQYKLYGNSIVEDVLFHIFRKMFIQPANEAAQQSLF